MEFGKYDIQEELGKGGFGIVYQAVDKLLNREVAIKVLHPGLVVDPNFVKRFKREAQIAANLDHQNLVPVYEFGEEEGRYYISMGFMPGGSLKGLITSEGAQSYDRALELITQIGSGLAYAHKANVIHRDLKPANILFDAGGKARVADMGFAKLVQTEQSTSITTSGGMVGTAAFMAPEVWKGQTASPATDVYSLACVFVELLTGTPLFAGETTPVIMMKHFQPLNLPAEIPNVCRGIVEKALAKDPTERTQNVDDFINQLHNPNLAESPAYPGIPNVNTIAFELEMGIANPADPETPAQSSSPKPQRKSEISQPIKQPQTNSQSTTTMTRKSAPPIQTVKKPKVNRNLLIGLGFALFAILAYFGYSAIKSYDLQTKAMKAMTTVTVPEGAFVMGSDSGEWDEAPVRNITLTEFQIFKNEVTNQEYSQCVEAKKCKSPYVNNLNKIQKYYGDPYYNDYPVVNLTWQQASDYCQWIGGSLPTEAQWEKAARGEYGRVYPWGNDLPNRTYANYDSNIGDISKVGSFENGMSRFGAMDMAGNVWEWVQDRYGNYDAGNLKNPSGPNSGSERVIRGGSWGSDAESIRSSNRFSTSPDRFYANLGFRCVIPQK